MIHLKVQLAGFCEFDDGFCTWNFLDDELAVGSDVPILRLPIPAPADHWSMITTRLSHYVFSIYLKLNNGEMVKDNG